MRQRFPELEVDSTPSTASTGYQRVRFTVPRLSVRSPLNFGNKANIYLDGGTDDPSSGPLFDSTVCSGSTFKLTHKDVNMAVRGFRFTHGSGTCDISTNNVQSGGMFLLQNQAILSVNTSKFYNNRASLGAVIANFDSFLNVYNSAFEGNGPTIAEAQKANPGLIGGGAIATDGSGTTKIYGNAPTNFGMIKPLLPKVFDITAEPGNTGGAPAKFTEFTANAANTGGALFCRGNSKLYVRNAKFNLNVAASLNSAAQFSNEQTAGGAIAALNGCQLNVAQSIFSMNEAIGSGSAISVEGNSASVIESNIFEDHRAYLNTHTSPGQVLGGVIASRGSDMQVFKNSFRSSQSAFGTILVIGTSTDGVHITNNTIQQGVGRSYTPTSVVSSGFPWKINSTVDGSVRGTTAIEVRNLLSGFGSTKEDQHDEISHNTIFNNDPLGLQDVKIDSATIGFFNNLIVRRLAIYPPCKFTNYTFGQSKGNAEYHYPYGGGTPDPSCVDPAGVGSKRENPLLSSIETGFENRFRGGYPALYFFPGIQQPGDPNIVDYEADYNEFDQFGNPREEAPNPHLAGSYTFNDSLF